jgi:hypothetical protein
MDEERDASMIETQWTRRDFLAITIASGLTVPGCTRRLSSRSNYSQKVLAKHPVAYWRLGESNGPTAFDATRQGHDGIYHGSAAFHEIGAIKHDQDTAIKLDGLSSYVEIHDSPQFSQAGSGRGLTVEVWMRPDLLVFPGETDDPYIHWLGKGEAGKYEWGFRFYSRESSRPNRISAYIWNPSGSEGAGAYFQDPLKEGEWIHVVACYDAGDRTDPQAGVSIFKNGSLRGSPASQPGAHYKSYDIMPVHGPSPLRFGTRDLRSFLIGGLDEIAIYPRVLTPAEIQYNYAT